MNLPKKPNTFGSESMKVLGLEPSQNWPDARAIIIAELLSKKFVDVYHHIIQAMLGERIDAGDNRNRKWSMILLVAIQTRNQTLIEMALDTIAEDILRK
ncbi:MAG: hypothetical protein AAB443_02395 [Patescibacteria group bacterium]